MIRVFSQYVSPKTFLLVGLEAVLMVLSLLCSVRLRCWGDFNAFASYTGEPRFGWRVLLVVVIYQICFYLNDLYDPQPSQRRPDQALRLAQSLGAASLFLGLLYIVVPSLLVGRGVFLLNMILAAGFVVFSRVAVDRLWVATPAQKIVILGSGGLASTVAREIAGRKDLRMELLGFVEPGSAASPCDTLFGRPILGHVDSLESLACELDVSRIIVAMEDRRGMLPVATLVKLRVHGIVVEDAHSAIAALTGRVWLNAVRPSWFVFSEGFYRSRLTLLIKRALDIYFGLLGLVVSSPIMALVAIAIKLDSHGPILYRQERTGWRSRPFNVLKFRSMRVDAEAQSGAKWADVNDPRVTRLGAYLRKFRLDELPQFWNVLRGDMSFVGPRPERPVFVAELRKLIPYYDERHSVSTLR